jgi:peptidyl-Lys metalloendopeptidase
MRRIQSVGLTAAFTLMAGCAGSNEGATAAASDPVTLEAQVKYFDGCVAAQTSSEGLVDSRSECAASARGLQSSIDVVNGFLAKDQDVTVRWTVRNNGNRTAWLPRWQAPKPELESNLFQVSLDGQRTRYIGKVVKRQAPIPTDFVAIAPGKSLSATVKLSAFYDMAQAGEYVIQHQSDALSVFGGSNEATAAMVSNPVAAVRTEPALVAEPDLAVQPAAASLTTRNCTASEKTAITSALSQADTYAKGAQAYLQAGTRGSRYTTWFGTYAASRYSTALTHYTAIRNAIETKGITVDCGCNDDYYAYVYPNQPYIIYVCNAFDTAPIKGTDSKAGTLIHELSHFNVVASTDDRAYGQSACKSLAKSNPAGALDNADTHEYFAENNPALN